MDLTLALSEPRNKNQILASDYRDRQLNVLQAATLRIAARLNLALSCGAYYQQSHRTTPNQCGHQGSLPDTNSNAELLSLECGFEWLEIQYPEIFTSVVEMISQDQDEPLPLDWIVLIEDWEHTYWVVWLYVIWLLWATDHEDFRLRHGSLSSWILCMNG